MVEMRLLYNLLMLVRTKWICLYSLLVPQIILWRLLVSVPLTPSIGLQSSWFVLFGFPQSVADHQIPDLPSLQVAADQALAAPHPDGLHHANALLVPGGHGQQHLQSLSRKIVTTHYFLPPSTHAWMHFHEQPSRKILWKLLHSFEKTLNFVAYDNVVHRWLFCGALVNRCQLIPNLSKNFWCSKVVCSKKTRSHCTSFTAVINYGNYFYAHNWYGEWKHLVHIRYLPLMRYHTNPLATTPCNMYAVCPKKHAHGSHFRAPCSGQIMFDFTHIIKCCSAGTWDIVCSSGAALANVKTNHTITVCMFYMIYCIKAVMVTTGRGATDQNVASS